MKQLQQNKGVMILKLRSTLSRWTATYGCMTGPGTLSMQELSLVVQEMHSMMRIRRFEIDRSKRVFFNIFSLFYLINI